MYSFSEYFFFSSLPFSSGYFFLICVHLPPILSFLLLHCIKCGRHLSDLLVTQSECATTAGCDRLGVVAASSHLFDGKKKRELLNFSKWARKELLRIKSTLMNCFKILLWPKRRMVAHRYSYYSTLSAHSLLIPRPCCQGKLLILNLTGILKGTL